MGMDKMLNPQTRRSLMARPRPRTILIIALATITSYYLLFSGPSPQLHVVPYLHENPEKPLSGGSNTGSGGDYFAPEEDTKDAWEIDIEDLRHWRDPDDKEDPDDLEPGYETDGTDRDCGEIGKLQHEKDMRKMWRYAYKTTAKYVAPFQILFFFPRSADNSN